MISNIKNPLISFVVCILAVLPSVNAQQLPAYPRMTHAAEEDMVKTYGFYMAQTYSLQYISKKFPELARDVIRIQAEFDYLFKSSLENIDAIMSKENQNWEAAKPQLVTALRKQVDDSNVTITEARAFIQEVSSRIKGKIPSPYLETLLIYKSSFMAEPALEFLQGYRRTFSTESHPKSKGVNFHIQYPSSWKAQEGRRPNIISVIKSENGRGGEMIMLLVEKIPVAETEKPTASELKELFSAPMMKQMLPSNAKLISSVPIKLDGLPGATVTADIEEQRLDVIIKMRVLYYILLFKNNLIHIQCSVVLSGNESNMLQVRFKHFEQLFRLIGNSLVVQSQW